MAYENLKAAIKQAIKQNGNQEITGNILQSTLLNIVNTLGADYKFLGFAIPSTVPPTSEECRLFYFASEAGEYDNFPTSGENTYINIGGGLYVFTKEANSDYWKADSLIEIAQYFGNDNKSVLSQAFMTEKFNELFAQQNKFLPNRFNISITKTWKATIDSKKTDISLYKGLDYSIKLESYNGTSEKIIACIRGDVEYQALLKLNEEVDMKPRISGPLVIYTYPDAQEEASVVISISTKEYANLEKEVSDLTKSVYVISKDTDGDFTTITDALKALKNNVSPKIIKINGGEYDVFAEQGGEEFLNSIQSEDPNDWIKYNNLIPDNTEIIGIGTVIIKYELPNEISQNKANILSPLNVRGNNVRIENITVIGNNCRYCVHDENGTAYPYSNHIYKNCRFLKSGKGSQAVGIGFSKNAQLTFEKCILRAHNNTALYMHTNDKTQDYSNLLIDSCTLISNSSVACSLECSSLPGGGKSRIAVTINNSYANSIIELLTRKKTNYYEMIFCNSNIAKIISDAVTTPFPPSFFNSTGL